MVCSSLLRRSETTIREGRITDGIRIQEGNGSGIRLVLPEQKQGTGRRSGPGKVGGNRKSQGRNVSLHTLIHTCKTTGPDFSLLSSNGHISRTSLDVELPPSYPRARASQLLCMGKLISTVPYKVCTNSIADWSHISGCTRADEPRNETAVSGCTREDEPRNETADVGAFVRLPLTTFPPMTCASTGRGNVGR